MVTTKSCLLNGQEVLKILGYTVVTQRNWKNVKTMWNFLNKSSRIVCFLLLFYLPFAQCAPKV